MDFTEVAYPDFLHSLRLIPACENYHDTLINQSGDYLAQYRFFKTDAHNLFSLSPESNAHLYSKDEVAIGAFLAFLAGINLQPKVFFSFYQNDLLIRATCPERVLTAKPFFYFKKTPLAAVASEKSIHIRMATLNDQDLINKWYASFNLEEGSSWVTPDMAKDPHSKLYLMFSDSLFVGAAANTLICPSRLWIGRLWIDQPARKLNLATQLMVEIEKIAHSEGRDLSLLVSTQNEKALGLYQKLGFSEIALNSYWY